MRSKDTGAIKVAELIRQLQMCHPEDNVIVSFDDPANATEDFIRLFGSVLEVNQATPERLGEIVLIVEGHQ